MPEVVVPSLFWVVPVGDWRYDDLYDLWQLFTEKKGVCKDLGLILIKGDLGRKTGSDLDLLGGANLQHLLPKGVNLPRSSFGTKHLLFLSGGYPQPGWGMLVRDIEMSNPSFFIEDIVSNILRLMKFENELDEIKNAVDAYHAKNLIEKKIKDKYWFLSDISNLNEKKLKIEALFESIHLSNLLSILDNKDEVFTQSELKELGQYRFAYEYYKLDAHQKTKFLDVSSRLNQECNRERHQIIFDAADKEGLKLILKLWRNLKNNRPVPLKLFEEESIKYFDDQNQFFKNYVHKIYEEINASIAFKCKIHENQQSRLKIDLLKAEDCYKLAYIKATEAQWELGPKFLVALEQICLQKSIKTTSITWDQPRMIGWKLWVSGVNFSLEDIHETAASLSGNQSLEMNMAGDGAMNVSGSYFTDYVHFLACQDINKSSRAVTCEFVNQLTRLSDRRNLFRFYSKDEYPATLSPELIIDQLITVLGWPNDNAQLVPSLASCVNTVGKAVLSGNDIRIILESYCRDFLDVLTSQRNYSVDNLLELVRNHRPDYRYNDGSWDRHVSKLSFGSAIICIEALCIQQFKRQQQTITALVSSIKILGFMANARSHFSETNSQNEWNPDHVGKLIKEILGLTHELISEMPWHFTETQSNGTHPKVLTGNAWSHSHPNPRLIRVLLWRGTERVYPNQLIWNPRRTNPVMTDPTIIKRPR